MKPSLRISLCILGLPLVVGAAFCLDRWIFARAANPLDGSHAWARSLSFLTISLILLALSWLVLVRGSVSRFVASIYLLGGLLLTLLQPLAVFAVVTHATSLQSALAFSGPLLTFLLACGAVSHFTFAFITAIGVGGFLRSYVFTNPRNA